MAAAAVAEVDGDLDGDLTMITLEPTLEEVLEEGISRLKERPTWKLWTWLADQKEFTDSESFRQHVTENHIPEELRRYVSARSPARALQACQSVHLCMPIIILQLPSIVHLVHALAQLCLLHAFGQSELVILHVPRHIPRDDPKSPERPAEEAFRKRMCVGKGRLVKRDENQAMHVHLGESRPTNLYHAVAARFETSNCMSSMWERALLRTWPLASEALLGTTLVIQLYVQLMTPPCMLCRSDLLARVHQQNQRSLEEAAKSGPGKDRTGRKEREDKRAQVRGEQSCSGSCTQTV